MTANAGAATALDKTSATVITDAFMAGIPFDSRLRTKRHERFGRFWPLGSIADSCADPVKLQRGGNGSLRRGSSPTKLQHIAADYFATSSRIIGSYAHEGCLSFQHRLLRNVFCVPKNCARSPRA